MSCRSYISNLVPFYELHDINNDIISLCRYRPQTKLWEGNVFTCVCPSTGGGYLPIPTHPPAGTTEVGGTYSIEMPSCLNYLIGQLGDFLMKWTNQH